MHSLDMRKNERRLIANCLQGCNKNSFKFALAWSEQIDTLFIWKEAEGKCLPSAVYLPFGLKNDGTDVASIGRR